MLDWIERAAKYPWLVPLLLALGAAIKALLELLDRFWFRVREESRAQARMHMETTDHLIGQLHDAISEGVRRLEQERTDRAREREELTRAREDAEEERDVLRTLITRYRALLRRILRESGADCIPEEERREGESLLDA